MVVLRSLKEIPESYKNLAWKLFAAFLKGHRQVDTVADKCKEIPIKSGERGGRSCSEKMIFTSIKCKDTTQFSRFKNKTGIIESD